MGNDRLQQWRQVEGAPMTRLASGIFLLRKSKGGESVPVVKDQDLPFRFIRDGRTFEISQTRKGGLIMTEVK
jgi:hypothetical protein